MFKKILAVLLLLCATLSACKEAIKPLMSTGQYELIESFAPFEDCTFESGSIAVVSVSSPYDDISASAIFNGQTISLTKQYINGDEQTQENSLIHYIGSFTMPNTEKEEVIGQIKFVCKKGNTEEIYYSGMVTVLPSQQDTASGNSKENVGQSYIAEVLHLPSETFNSDTLDDASRPVNSYLPKGTVDYCSSTPIVNTAIGKSYRLLRYGKRVYDGDNIRIYKGTLPKNNTMSVEKTETEGKYTVLSLFSDWKAPFTLELKEQSYYNTSSNDWRVSEAQFTYVEIRFMYCNEFLGEVTFDRSNPLFTHSEKTVEDNCTVLRLYLKNKGCFYGFKAEYDEFDSLVFKFLQPTRLYSGQNEYGYSLLDKVIVVDAGHGGNEPGALGKDGTRESVMNLAFSNLLKKELESLGATVIMTRTDDTYKTSAERISTVLNAEPDFLISVHRNAGKSNGYSSYYFNAFSASASKYIHDSVFSTGAYKNSVGSKWHFFFLNRTGICPAVLTENGFMSDSYDLNNMKDANHQMICVKATVKGIINYFASQPK